MKILWLWLIPFAITGLLFAIDEFYFHPKRGLPRWERIGHPIDAMSVVACLSLILATPPTRTTIFIYAGLSLFSTLLITKDEWIHARECTGGEQWLHSLLFVLHPWVLAISGLFWASLHSHPWIHSFEARSGLPLPDPGTATTMIVIQLSLVSFFMIYQIVRWRFIWS